MEWKKIHTAIFFAAESHRGQFRKGTEVPYIIHPLNVGKLLVRYGCSLEIVTAGILHDTVEDTAVTIEDIHRSFGEKVATIVAGTSEPDKTAPWEYRKHHTIDFLKTASMDILLVACADKLDNIRTIREDLELSGESVWSRFNRSKKFQRWYYTSLADIFVSRMEKGRYAVLARRVQSEVAAVFINEIQTMTE